MLKITLLEMFLRTIPEGILISFAIYVFSNKEINKTKLLISGIIFGISTYLVRLLPISFGIHTILLIIIFILVSINYNKIEIRSAISSSVLCPIIMVFYELINSIFVVNILNISVKYMLNNPLKKTLLGMPSLVLFGVTVFIYYKLKYQRKKEL